jgi:UDP-N-acetylglucosamine 1-carboxyvinyltransferase
MAKFIIEGGKPLSGSVTPSGNKNEALPALMACLLTDGTITFQNMPRIGDVMTTCEILADIGVAVNWIDNSTLTLCAKDAKAVTPNAKLCTKIRASIMLLGPMLSRFGVVNLPIPGGDVIGARRVDTHWEGIEALGGQLELENRLIKAKVLNIVGADVFLDEPSVTGTENILLLAVRCKGVTTIHNAACEPHVVGVCNLLNSMGAKISGVGSNRLTIEGVQTLHGTTHRITADFMEVGSFLCLGAIGGGVVTIQDVKQDDYRFILKTLARLGIDPEVGANSLTIDGSKPIEMRREVTGRIGTIYSGPWPAYPTDLMSVAIVAATQSKGTKIFFEKMFEARMFFTDRLMDMNANIVLCDPHRIVVTGPSKLYAAKMSSPDVRAGMALVMAALIAEGKSTIDNIYQIERGYYDIAKKLQSLGASIIREET